MRLGGPVWDERESCRGSDSKPSIVSLPSFVEHFIPPVTKNDEENRVCEIGLL